MGTIAGVLACVRRTDDPSWHKPLPDDTNAATNTASQQRFWRERDIGCIDRRLLDLKGQTSAQG
ncbi:MAG TPA: hypothetical protein DDW52_07640 [Planctomycetaceae bacterium]|nr:hypothetical protein [Planctomycetaceae bacterium]